MSRNLLEAIAVLTGTIIGAGVLGIPYVVAKAGFLTGAVAIIVLGLALIMLHLYLGEVSLRTKGIHQITGYAKLYLGKWGERLTVVAMLVGIYGALIAYIIGEGVALNAIFGINATVASLLFFAVMAAFVFIGLKVIKGSELWLNLVMILVIGLIIVLSLGKIKATNLADFSFMKLLIPYGVILFAFLGTAAIPELNEILKKERKKLKKAIIIGSLIPLILYFLFALVVVGVGGVKEIATVGLGEMIGQHMVVLGNLFAVVAMATSFLALALALKWVFQYDYRINKHIAWGLTCFIPLAIGLSKVTGFIQVIGIAGAVAGGIEGTLIVLMHRKAKKLGKRKPEYSIKSNMLLTVLLIAMFVGGIVYTFVTL
jgi:amino acid permease